MESEDFTSQVQWMMQKLTQWRMTETLKAFTSELAYNRQIEEQAQTQAKKEEEARQQIEPRVLQPPFEPPEGDQNLNLGSLQEGLRELEERHRLSDKPDTETPEEIQEENSKVESEGEDEDDEWNGDDDPGFMRVQPTKERAFIEDELWAPDIGARRPSFSRGAGITVKEHRHYVRDLIEREHKKLQRELAEAEAVQEAREKALACGEQTDIHETQSPPLSEPGQEILPQKHQLSPPPPPEELEQPQPQLEKFSLQVIYEKGKTGFEENQEYPVKRGHVIAGRYQILEYIGSAAFSHAVQCLDLKTKHLVCVKIIKNSKDFFDQSLDEIKLLQYINRSGDADENCVLQLYDYFYHKEHLFLVSELLRDNLYEFSKFNREQNPDAPYFTIQRLQKITKQVFSSSFFRTPYHRFLSPLPSSMNLI
eukprot:TRINITY_DN4077_c0_g1_i1.p1 TRINITY_DN4077_c0_g1~~TRINITY_DN4077_c0_g1_i1.p1  ORF type:complete len:423 (+),score=92.87 TRINITY_DN4077_c0_g1_i1:167-1435(+)